MAHFSSHTLYESEFSPVWKVLLTLKVLHYLGHSRLDWQADPL